MATKRQLNDINKSIDVVIILNNRPLAGQQGAVLNQHRDAINITNKIRPEWEENLAGARSWNIKCSGAYVLNQDTLRLLQSAFMSNEELQVLLTIDGIRYTGKVLLTDFPLTATFNVSLKYNATLLGTGPLSPVE